jgi:hypothetical protein
LAIELAINIFGVMLSYWVGQYILICFLPAESANHKLHSDYGFSYNKSEAQFRVPIAIQIVFAILTFVGVVFLPESPRWVRHKTASF